MKRLAYNSTIKKTKLLLSGPIILWQIDRGEVVTVTDFIFLGSKITVHSDCIHEIKRLSPWKKSHDKAREHIKSKDITLLTMGSIVNYGVYSSHVGYESWTIKRTEHQSIVIRSWCLRTLTLESPLDCKDIQPVHPEGDQTWVFIGRTDAEADTPIFWPTDAKS